MEAIVSRCAALDVHKNTVMGCVRTPDGKGGRSQEVREFRTLTAGLRALREWPTHRPAGRCGTARPAFPA